MPPQGNGIRLRFQHLIQEARARDLRQHRDQTHPIGHHRGHIAAPQRAHRLIQCQEKLRRHM